jgi:RNA polymerase sigma-70 factor (ECF subfamily)
VKTLEESIDGIFVRPVEESDALASTFRRRPVKARRRAVACHGQRSRELAACRHFRPGTRLERGALLVTEGGARDANDDAGGKSGRSAEESEYGARRREDAPTEMSRTHGVLVLAWRMRSGEAGQALSLRASPTNRQLKTPRSGNQGETVVRRASNTLVLPPFEKTSDSVAATNEPARQDWRDQVFALVYRQMRKLAGRRDVDELVQVAAEQALRSLPSFEGRSQLATWTFRICYLTVLKHDRWYRRWLRRFSLTDDGQLPEAPTEVASGDEHLEHRERRQRLHIALAQLSHKRRAVIVLHDLEGLPVEEVAEIVGAVPAAVRSRLRDGRKALALLLASDPYFGADACARKDGR